MSRFQNLEATPPDAAFSLIAAFTADESPGKVDLCPGFYRDGQARPWVLPCIAQAEELIHEDPIKDHEHLPLSGHPGLVSGAQRLVFGLEPKLTARIASVQTVSGTGANHLGARFLSDALAPERVWISDPSWINHPEVWQNVNPDIERRAYPYYAKDTQSVDFDGMVDTLRRDAASGDIVILHGCAHNPTGLDLTEEQWKTVAKLCKEKGLFPFFDLAYQGFASGNLEKDAWPIRHFVDGQCMEVAVAQSFSKNFGLYGERVGALHIVTQSAEVMSKVVGKLTRLQRAEITSPPAYGARIVARILGDARLMDQWQDDLDTMSGRMKQMRKRLYEELKKRDAPGSWDHILSEIGMFSMTGLSASQVTELRYNHHIYLLPSGRISVTGLTEGNVGSVAEAFSKVLRNTNL